MTLENEKSKILGDYLRSRRERIKPDNTDLEVVGRFGRRRTPGLRREEVAHLAGVSITWYTWLEQGRAITTSREVIESIGRALQLSSEEKLHLLRLANFSEEVDSLSYDEEINSELQSIINQLSYPAIIANLRTEVLAYNQMASEIIVDFQAIPSTNRVMTRLVFSDPNLRKQLTNWKEFADYTIGVFRSYFDQKAGDPWYETFVQQMCQESEEFQKLWGLHNVQQKKVIPYTFDHPDVGRLFFHLNSFTHINGNANLHCCVFTPVAGTDTEQKLKNIQI